MAVTLPSTPLAAQADLDALAARVAALEHATPIPPVDKPSPDGAMTNVPGYTLVDKFLAKWALVVDTVRPPNRISHNGVVDPVTGNVSSIGIFNGGQLYQWAPGGVWVADSAGAWTQTTDPTAPAPQPGSLFKVSGGQIHKPDGTVFKGTGVDIWWTCFSSRDGGVNQGAEIISDWNTGAPLLEAFPKLNIIRLACFMESSGLGGFPTQAELQQLVDFCTRKKIVLLLDPHDYSGGSNWVYNWQDGSLATAEKWVATMGAAWKANPYVWTQTENEPGTPNADEINTLYDAWRNAGNPNPVIIGWVTYGYTDRVDRGITDRMTNVGIDVHFYAMTAGSDNMNEQDHINKANEIEAQIRGAYRSADGEIPVGCYEFGDACCGHVEAAGQVACSAVTKSNFKSWSLWNWTTTWNRSWGHDVINIGGRAVNAGTVVNPAMLGV
jgi:hypothetical protein